MNDDCTPMCMPRQNEPKKNRVCTKGCNQLVKVPKEMPAGDSKDAADESKLYNMVVCQAEKRVSCSPPEDGSVELVGACTTKKWVETIVRCDFTLEVWNAGATCIEDTLNNATEPACVGVSPAIIQAISKTCETVVAQDQKTSALCSQQALMF